MCPNEKKIISLAENNLIYLIEKKCNMIKWKISNIIKLKNLIFITNKIISLIEKSSILFKWKKSNKFKCKKSYIFISNSARWS